MASQQQSQPALLSATRRFGRCETFHRFDNLSSGHASVGTKSIGKMTVDCQFLFKKSRWGVLGDGRFPAGIIYLDFNFGPPQGCRVKSATITVTLDDNDECLRPYKARPGRTFHKSDCPVQMTDWYGPKQLAGEQKSNEYKRTMRMAPEINVFGTGAGGVGVDSEKAFKTSSRWTFNGQLLPGKDTWTYKTLKWDLTENDLDTQAFRSSHVHTAFAFEHSGQPFLMKVEIEGRLEKWNHRMKSKLKFGQSKNKDEGQTTTMIDFGQLDMFRSRLDELARSLPRAMEMENYEEIPVEIPDRVPTFFQQTLPETGSTANIEVKPQQEDNQQQETLNNITELPHLGAPKIPQRLQDQHYLTPEELTEPTLENLRRVVYALSRPVEQDIIQQSPPASFSSSSTRVEVEEEQEQEQEQEQERIFGKEEEPKMELQLAKPDIDQDAMLKILQIPAMLTILQLIARLMDMLGTSSGEKKVIV